MKSSRKYELDKSELNERLEKIKVKRRALMETLEKPLMSSENPSFKCIECNTTEHCQIEVQNGQFSLDKFCSLKCMETNVEKVQKTWLENSASKRAKKNNESPSSATKKLINGRKSMGNEPTENTVNMNVSTSRKSFEKEIIYKVPPLTKNLNPSTDYQIQTSPRGQLSQSAAPVNISKANFEAEVPQGDPSEWSCDEVYRFIILVAGESVAEMFRSQEVDGSALSLIRDDHLVNTMQIKLGPALKIINKFNELKNRFA